MTTKQCYTCNEVKPVSDFTIDRQRANGYRANCKVCRHTARKGKRKNETLKRTHGITLEDYDVMMQAQDSKCAICGTSESRTKQHPYLVVDHCHTSGSLRGLLCHNCNTGLGQFQDNPSILNKAISYLAKYNLG